MKKMYKIVVGENDDLGIDFNSFVANPAHTKNFIAFGKEMRYHFNEEKRMVTGVMIASDVPIYRRSEGQEYYVVFDAKTIDIIRRKFFRNGFVQNLNKEHSMDNILKGATLVDSYIVSNSDPKLPNVPDAFGSLNLKDGSWLASYHIHDDKLWDEVKSGNFGGYSVEGYFDLKELNIKTNNKMKKSKNSFWDLLKSKFNDEPQDEPTTFAQATTADGVVVFYDGELGVGTALQVEADGERLPAPEGDHELTLEDGSVKVVSLDIDGVVTAMEDVVEMSTEEQVAEVIAQMSKDMDTRFKAIEKENSDLKAEIEAIKKGEKFGANPKKTADEKPSYKDLLNKK